LEVASDLELLELSQEIKNGKFDSGKYKSIALSNITSMGALHTLNSFSGILAIRENPQLITLEGLENLTRIGSLLIEDNANLTSTDHLPRLKSIKGDFELKANPSLMSLSLPSLAAVEGNMEVTENEKVSTTQLQNLDNVGGALVMRKNEVLDSVVLPNLTFIGRRSFPFVEQSVQFSCNGRRSFFLTFFFFCGCEMDILQVDTF
jgi:hypothetical protein